MQTSKSEPKQLGQAAGTQASAAPEVTEWQDEAARLRAENERLTEELRREHEMYIRNLADFDNYRRRVERERGQVAQSGKRELLLPLLEVMDDFDRALQHSNADPQSLAAGLQAIQRRLAALLATEGVTAFESRGKLFNPLLHEAISTIESEEIPPGTVLDEVSRGWRWGDELLRPARVRVAQ
jgi:molecular chaperone GrpE